MRLQLQVAAQCCTLQVVGRLQVDRRSHTDKVEVVHSPVAGHRSILVVASIALVDTLVEVAGSSSLGVEGNNLQFER